MERRWRQRGPAVVVLIRPSPLCAMVASGDAELDGAHVAAYAATATARPLLAQFCANNLAGPGTIRSVPGTGEATARHSFATPGGSRPGPARLTLALCPPASSTRWRTRSTDDREAARGPDCNCHSACSPCAPRSGGRTPRSMRPPPAARSPVPWSQKLHNSTLFAHPLTIPGRIRAATCHVMAKVFTLSSAMRLALTDRLT